MKIKIDNLHISNAIKVRIVTQRIANIITCQNLAESIMAIEMWIRKTYTYLEINTPERCNRGVVAKPGIATGSRSK